MHHRGTEIELLSKNGPPKPEYLVESAASISGGLAPSQRKWQTAHLIGKPELRPRAVKGTRMMTRWRSHIVYAARANGYAGRCPAGSPPSSSRENRGKGPRSSDFRIPDSGSRPGHATHIFWKNKASKLLKTKDESQNRTKQSQLRTPCRVKGIGT